MVFRSVFVSDVHLGSAGCMAEEFQSFLSSIHTDYLYVVGDFVDVWLVIKAGKWKQQHTKIVRTILGMSDAGTIVRFTPGNHDAFARRINGVKFANIEIDHSFVHETADGRRFHVVHGDLFDASVTRMQWMAWLGCWAYEILLGLNDRVNARRERSEKEPVDFVTHMKKRLKRLVKKMTSFEESLMQFAEDNQFDGVVCGHIHRPAKQMHENGRLYLNTGDWVENGTCLVEHFDGSLELMYWDARLGKVTSGLQPSVREIGVEVR